MAYFYIKARITIKFFEILVIFFSMLNNIINDCCKFTGSYYKSNH
jgi:hypothetical protein